MIQILKDLDHELFSYINGFHSLFWDDAVIFLSDKSWFIVMAILLASAIYIYKKNFWIVALAIGLSWGLADLSSTRIFKNNVKRLRPCHTQVHKDAYTPAGCGGQYGFVSSHASNSIAIAVMCIILFSHWTKYISLAWAILVCYTRLYLGKHYPLDLLCGGMLGALCAVLIYLLLVKKLKNKFANDL